MSKTILVKCRNNADARALGSRRIEVPGATEVTHTGRSNVRIVTSALAETTAWLCTSFLCVDFEVQP